MELITLKQLHQWPWAKIISSSISSAYMCRLDECLRTSSCLSFMGTDCYFNWMQEYACISIFLELYCSRYLWNCLPINVPDQKTWSCFHTKYICCISRKCFYFFYFFLAQAWELCKPSCLPPVTNSSFCIIIGNHQTSLHVQVSLRL